MYEQLLTCEIPRSWYILGIFTIKAVILRIRKAVILKINVLINILLTYQQQVVLHLFYNLLN